MKSILFNDFIEIILHAEDKLLVQRWSDKYPTLQEFREVIDATLSLQKIYNAERLLADTSVQPVVGADRFNYAASALPTLADSGMKKIAFVLSEDIFARQRVREFAAENQDIQIQYFNNEKKAMAWLLA